MSGLPTDLQMRTLRDTDAPEVVALVREAYAAYPGCVLDLDGVDADLPRLASSLREGGGTGWGVVDGTDVVGCVGLSPSRLDAVPAVELKRLYVAAPHRRRGVGRALVRRVEEVAATEHGVGVVELWTDTRFIDAHMLYDALGYVRRPETRRLHDPSDTTEFHYVRELD